MDPLLGILDGDLLGEVQDGALGSAVGGCPADDAHAAEHAAQVDDPPTVLRFPLVIAVQGLLPQELRDRVLGAEKDAPQVHTQDLIPPRLVEEVDYRVPLGNAEAGIIDHNIQTSAGTDGRSDSISDVRSLRDVALYKYCFVGAMEVADHVVGGLRCFGGDFGAGAGD